ncbi:MAG: ABC transporter permease [Gammaproteobacteria bacterium]
MFLTNFRVAISWAMKQPLYYALKVLGLALGIMAVALLVSYVDFVAQYDAHIPARDRIYRLTGEYISRENGDRVRYHFGSNAWVEPFKQEYAGEFTSAGVVVERNGVLAYETTVHDQDFYFADPNIIPLFGLTLVEGDAADALIGPNKILLSESAAVKYFGTAEGAVGKTLTLDQAHYLAVSGVFQDLPRQTNFPMEALVSFDTTERVLGEAVRRNSLWIMFNRYTMFVRFDDPAKAQAVNADLPAFAYRRSPEQDLPILERNKFTLRLQPLSEVYLDPLTGNTSGDDFTRRNTYVGIWILSLLIILGACVNFISLTIGQLQLRLKELGVRTSFGASKSSLVIQLVAESLIVSGPAVLLSLNLLYALVPAFAAVVAVPMMIDDVLTFDVWGWVALLVLLVCAFVSAAPVLLSSQDTVKGLALKRHTARLSWRAGSAVVFFQFALSTLAALIVLGIFLQVSLLRNIGTGFDPRNLVSTDTRYEGANADASGFEALKTELGQLADVEALAALSVIPPNTGSFTNWIRMGDGEPLQHTMSHIRVSPDFLSTWRIAVIAGRNFSLDYPSELITNEVTAGQTFGILLTRSAVRRFGFASPEDAVGQPFKYSMDTIDLNYTVIGVVEDFRFSPMESDVESIAVLLGTVEPLRNITLRLREGYDTAAIDDINAVWSRHIPGVPFNISFMEDVIGEEIAGRTQSLALAASMATIVFFCTAIIGIYAQAAFVCDRNAKSIAIRKVFGSSKGSILRLLLAQFSAPVVASFALALPTALYFIREFYSSFQQTPGYPVWLYVLCLGGIVSIALVTVLAHCQRAASRHPIHTLRYE